MKLQIKRNKSRLC